MKLLNLPNELLVAIGSQIQSQSNLEVLSRANRRLHNLLTAELYHRDARTQKSVQWAVRMGRPEILQKAQSFGIVPDFDTFPLLHLAAKNGQVSILECLLPVENGWVLNLVSCSQFDGDVVTTPLAAACQYGHYGAVKVLLDHGADHTIANNSGLGPLHLAATFGCPIAVGLLLDSGADISSTTNGLEWTPLHFACKNGNLAAAKLLVNRVDNISARDHVGRQPLFE
ncbi:hypothetical protein ACLOAV_008605 [Pseudogymnoascus australis]